MSPFHPILHPLAGTAAVALTLALSGCKEPAVAVYDAPKDPPRKEPAASMTGTPGMPNSGGAMPFASASPERIKFSAPPGWTQQPAGGMRLASFLITDAEGRKADVSVTTLGRDSGLLENVNRWRKQISLGDITREQLTDFCTQAMVGGKQYIMVDLAGTAPANPAKPDPNMPPMMAVTQVARPGQAANIYAVIQPAETKVWFTKMMGDAAVVEAEKNKMRDFALSIVVEEENDHGHAHGAPAAASGAPVPDPGYTWRIPAEWKVQEAGPMRLAQYLATPLGEAKPVEISVAMLAAQGGGLLANVNRWRAQISLPPTTEADLTPAMQTLTAKSGVIVKWVELKGKIAAPQPGAMAGPKFLAPGTEAVMYGALVSDRSRTWFFKLLGEAAAATATKERFLAMLDTVKPADGAPDEGPIPAAGATPAKPAAVPATNAAPAPTGKNKRGAKSATTAPATAATNSPAISATNASAAPAAGTVAARNAKLNAMATNGANIPLVTAGDTLKWTVPPKWKVIPPTPMRKATYQAGEGTLGDVNTAPTAAEIAVTAFPGDLGGLLSNMNRWRDQLGLPPVKEEDLKTLVKPTPAGPGRTASLVDLISAGDGLDGKTMMVVAVVPAGDATWFFKLIGPEKVVLNHRADFVQMISSIR